MEAAVKAAINKDTDGNTMRAKLKKNCTRFIEGSNTEIVFLIQGMQRAAEFTTLGEGADLILAKVNKGVLIYSLRDKTEDQWCEHVEGLEKKELPTPQKVLIKMIALRIRKIHEKRDKINKGQERLSQPKMMPQLPDFTSKAVLPQIEQIFSLHLSRIGDFREEFLDPLQKVFDKEGCDDDTVAAGFNLHVTQEVMEC